MNKNKSLSTKYILLSILILIIVSILLFGMFASLFKFNSTNSNIWLKNFSSDLTISINGKTYENIDLSKKDFKFPYAKKGDVIRISKKIPLFFSSNQAHLVFKTKHSAVKVFVNNMLVYAYGMSLMGTNKDIASSYHIVPIKQSDIGKTLEVFVFPNDNHSVTYFDRFDLCLESYIVFHIFRPFATTIAIDLSLIVFGIIGILTYTLAFITVRRRIMMLPFYLSGLLISMGIWSIANYGFLSVFNNNAGSGNVFEFGALYIAFLFYLMIITENISSVKIKSILYKFQILYVLFLASTFICNYMDILHFVAFLKVFHAISFIILLASIIILKLEYKNQSSSQKLLLIGQTFFSIGIMVQLILYSLIRYLHFIILKSYDYNIICTISVIFMIVFFLLSMILRLLEGMKHEQERMFLEKMAYNDILTGLANRQKCMIELIDLTKNKKPYHCIAFDLNFLKKANDSFGHIRGDMLLKDFAKCLNETFKPPCVNARTGGDEFLVIVPDSNSTAIENQINELYDLMNLVNCERNDGIILETAYGISSSDEVSDFDYEKIISLADERMYENKRKMKEKLKKEKEILEPVYSMPGDIE